MAIDEEEPPLLRPEQALTFWSFEGEIVPEPEPGLINRTWRVGSPPRAILQWVSPIFDPTIHHDIERVTAHLASRGVGVPRLFPTRKGGLWIDDREGCWRLMSYLPGKTLHRLASPRQAAAAGALVGRFHAAVQDLEIELRAPRRRIHETPARMVELEEALAASRGHPLEEASRRLGGEIADRWSSWDGDLEQPERICHGDLKISNLRFDTSGTRAHSLLDLDTLGPMALACELGDAWRSWCNRGGEDDPESSALDLEIFAASAEAYLREGPELGLGERRSLVPGIERICLELAARFCADAVRNSYFREDRGRYPEPGSHNLIRARGQLTLAVSARDRRAACEAVIG